MSELTDKSIILRTGDISIIDEPDNKIIIIEGVAYSYEYFTFKRDNREKDGVYYRIHQPREGTRGIFVSTYVKDDIQDELAKQSMDYIEQKWLLDEFMINSMERKIETFNSLSILKKLLYILSGKTI